MLSAFPVVGMFGRLVGIGITAVVGILHPHARISVVDLLHHLLEEAFPFQGDSTSERHAWEVMKVVIREMPSGVRWPNDLMRR